MLIAELICGLLEPYLKFKTLVNVYCSSIYLQSSLLKVVCLCYCELCLHHKLNHHLTAAKSVCVCDKINTQCSRQTRFLKVRFICLCVSRDTLWYIIKHFKKFCTILTSHLSGKWWVKLYTLRLQIKYQLR